VPNDVEGVSAMGPDVVVVLSYRGRNDTLRCVASLVDGNAEAQVVLVDNGSGDGVLEEVRRRWPDVETVQTGDNLGFAGGMNRGVQWALARDAASVTVLNNDTVVPPGVIATLVERAQQGVAVSPEVRYAADGRVWFGGGVVDAETGLARHLSEAEIAQKFPERVVQRMDSDTMERPGSHARVLDAFRDKRIDVLLGTQMIAKGLDFPNVTLVGVINADVGLHLPDFRAADWMQKWSGLNV